ncbi:hypothetical protein FSP39_016227 [Pinctada imbricata]|uniref:Tetraspanin n=1 Tax=Pinctada imbricata TaxID=66713 RepID=A0AA88YNF3_PINIB|nr:hypothetical protein FSP39_016227 [Pinctada imbricata]
MTGCCGTMAKCLLILFNLIFWLSGAAIMGVGVWFLVDKNIKSYFDVIDIDTQDEYFKYTAYLLIAFGAFVFFVGFCGCCGAIRDSKCLLGFYVFFLVLIIGGEIAGGVLMILYKSRIEGDLTKILQDTIKQKYATNTNVQNAWNFVQVELSCCGATGASDYANVSSTSTLGFPLTCCELTDKDAALNDPLAATPRNRTECGNQKSPFYHNKGCKDQLLDLASRYSIILIVIAMVIGGLEERVHSILTEDLEMRKLSAHWVPLRLLAVNQKHTRRTLSHANLNVFEGDPVNFLQRNMGLSFYPRGQTTVEKVEAAWLTAAKEGKDCCFSWEGYGLGFLGCRRYSADRLSPKKDKQLMAHTMLHF